MEFDFYNRQRRLPFDLKFVRAMAEGAVEACRKSIRVQEAPLGSIERLEVSILSDRAIARVHGEFFDDPTPTDVITFTHGELLIGAGVITANASTYGQSPSEECALCVIHGMLHLAGWDDLTPREAKEMKVRQEQIFKSTRKVLH